MKIKITKERIVLIALAVFSLVLLADKFTGFMTFVSLDKNAIGQKAIDYINQNLVQAGTKATLVEVRDMGNYYEVLTEYQGNQIPVYVSKDGKYLFLYAFDLSKSLKQESAENEKSTQEIPKTEKPKFMLFIMSYCPFGIQATKALIPVAELLGNKADISIHYVDYIMHGEKEAYENLRQYCIQKEQKDKFWKYMKCFVQSGDSEKCLSETGIDKSKLEVCMNETDKRYNITQELKSGKTYPAFLVETDLNNKYGVRGSPTIVINDVVVSLQRSPEAFKQAICSAFINPPEECNTKLSTNSASPGFGPLEGSNSSSSGTCG